MFKIHITYSVVFKMSICLFIGKVLCDGRPCYNYICVYDFMHGKWSSNELKRVRRVLVVYVGIFDFSLFWCIWMDMRMPHARIHLFESLSKRMVWFSYTHKHAYVMFCDCGVDYFRIFFHLLFINMTIIYKNVLLDFYWSCLSSRRNGKFGSYFLLCIH